MWGQHTEGDGWARVTLLRRQLQVAVKDEDFAAAARLRDEIGSLTEEMTPMTRLLMENISRISSTETAERVAAINALGELGDARACSDLRRALHGPEEVREAAHSALWNIWMRHPDPQITALMVHGCNAMMSPHTLPRADDIFTEIIRRDANFAEGYNKRATVYYMQTRYDDSVRDCLTALELNPYHFGAMSGLGLCYTALNQPDEAVTWWRRAVEIDPGLDCLRSLNDKLDDDGRPGGDAGPTAL
ncbi:unnamed protein product [Pedinophyceae sp. YPF-701]|nr:unnamed protein product [Pedinophyceae sp. YPF-701]